MFVGTHACLPVILAGFWDWKRVRQELPPRFSKVDLMVIALGGILPDLLNIHLSLEARHSSATHSIWFPLILAPFALIFFLPRFQKSFPTFLLAWLGVVLHLFCDLISGGIPLWGSGTLIIGKYYVHPVYWLPLDCISILFTWFVFFRIKYLVSKGTLVSPTCSWEEKILEDWRKREKR